MARPASGPLVDVSFVKPDHAPVPCSGRPQRGLPSVLPLVVLLTLGGCGGTGGGNGGGASGAAVNPVAPSNIEPQPTAALLPTGLAMTIRVDDINLLGVINPFGVVRGSRDRAAVGHAGIDVPLNSGAPLFAVGTGPILSVRPSVDSRPGDLVRILLAADSMPGTGWVFLYEHVTLLNGLGVGSIVSRGQQMATNSMETGRNNHLELSHVFNELEFTENQTCWVDQLDGLARTGFVNRFNTELRTDPRFISAWQSVDEGLPFRELLNTEKYPDGARMCYPPGTDERVVP